MRYIIYLGSWARALQRPTIHEPISQLKDFSCYQPLGAGGGHARHADSALRPWVIVVL